MRDKEVSFANSARLDAAADFKVLPLACHQRAEAQGFI